MFCVAPKCHFQYKTIPLDWSNRCRLNVNLRISVVQTSTSALKDCTTVRVSRSRASTEWAISGASIANRTAISATVTTRLSADVKVTFLLASISVSSHFQRFKTLKNRRPFFHWKKIEIL